MIDIFKTEFCRYASADVKGNWKDQLIDQPLIGRSRNAFLQFIPGHSKPEFHPRENTGF